jgi:hypothetical protein
MINPAFSNITSASGISKSVNSHSQLSFDRALKVPHPELRSLISLLDAQGLLQDFRLPQEFCHSKPD